MVWRSLLAMRVSESYHPPVRQMTDITLEEKGQNNLAFATLLQLGHTRSCVDLLIKTHRIPEAAIFARTYAPRYRFRRS